MEATATAPQTMTSPAARTTATVARARSRKAASRKKLA
uniref:Uncharacterized protein n=1 Tax=Arundo donax TaxID=35708 RepID=A0A0A8YTZ7_ARUDO